MLFILLYKNFKGIDYFLFAAKAWGDVLNLPVLCIHGFTDNAATFDHLIPFLPSGFYYVSLDLPSHGCSSIYPPGVILDFFSCLREIRRVLVQLKWTKCILLSHSVGSHFCLFLASLYPELVIKVIVIDFFPFLVLTDGDDICDRLRYIFQRSFVSEEKNFAAVRNNKMNENLCKQFEEKHLTISKKSELTLLQRVIIKKNGENNMICSDNRIGLLLFPLMTLDFHISVLNHIKSPVLLIVTSESNSLTETIPVIKKTIETIKGVLGNSVLVANVSGCHNVHLDHPERIAPIIWDFMISNTCLL